ncbi:hypothetical protein [Ktedonospora formicarum]|uniref:Moybdenum cofactor oxidoreductase dimerisation domain-containing protein n=1 Tax=Ktedonospora formicarum TaxID=2778364 RepID=A0A8J3I6L8_9CHLR|nr:hypothetical protein [Ktedonospora formicarum]GHO49626.1 hypothetical protein KSX_77890 [Ktedonospora formicarum]
MPENGETLPAGPLSIRGYAMTGGSHPIERVEISTDRGVTWTNARITERADPWSWCFWEHTVDLPKGEHMLCVRAYDTAGRKQPADRRQVWNLKGYANNAWHRIHVTIR